MKIIYVLDWDIVGPSSVLNKIEAKIRSWENSGNDVYLFIVSHGTKRDYIPALKNVKVFERGKQNVFVLSSIKTFFGRNNAFGKLYKELIRIQPDVVYLRPGTMWYPKVDRIVKRFKTVLEINSLDEEEVKLYYPINSIQYRIFKYGRNSLLEKCQGIVCLTNEIKNRYEKYGKKQIVISNGILDFHERTKFEKKETPNIIFVGTPGQLWQGFDKVFDIAKFMPNFLFHIVGPKKEDFDQIPENLLIHGYLNKKELDDLYKRCVVGIGTLSLYTKNMDEACPLKVREYVSYGLGVILGYIDTDFNDLPFTCYLGNYEKNVLDNLPKIASFIEEAKSLPVEIFHNEKFLVSYKEQVRLKFLADVCAN